MIKNLSVGSVVILLFTGCNKGSQSNDSVSTGAPADVKLAENRNLYSSGQGVEAAGSSSSSFGHEPKGSMEPTQTKTNVSFVPVSPDTAGATPSGTGGLIPPAIARLESRKSSPENKTNSTELTNPPSQSIQEVSEPAQGNARGVEQEGAVDSDVDQPSSTTQAAQPEVVPNENIEPPAPSENQGPEDQTETPQPIEEGQQPAPQE